MFEDSLMESGGKLKTKSKYWMIATFAFNGVILATMILIPLLYPEALPHTALTAMISAPPPPPPPPPPPTAGVAGMSGMGSGAGVPGGVMGGIGAAPAPVVKIAPPKGPARVSSGVISGLKISGANPTY